MYSNVRTISRGEASLKQKKESLDDQQTPELSIEITIWLFNIAVENGPFIDDFPIRTSIHKGFSMAMLKTTMVLSNSP